MARPTNTERIDSLSQELARLDATLIQKMANAIADLQRLDQEVLRLRQANELMSQRLVATEQRCLALETQSTRHWQVWLAIIGAFLALGVNVFRK